MLSCSRQGCVVCPTKHVVMVPLPYTLSLSCITKDTELVLTAMQGGRPGVQLRAEVWAATAL